MNTFTIQDPTGQYTFIGDESESWEAYAESLMSCMEDMTWFDWCVENLEQVILYV